MANAWSRAATTSGTVGVDIADATLEASFNMTDGQVKTIIPKVNGKTFRCESCNSNCFHWTAETRLECNGCGAWYEAVRESSDKGASNG